jgi:hypothetical protein
MAGDIISERWAASTGIRTLNAYDAVALELVRY